MCGFLETIVGQHITGKDDRNIRLAAAGRCRRSARKDDGSRGTAGWIDGRAIRVA
jgi:hypothetical protein